MVIGNTINSIFGGSGWNTRSSVNNRNASIPTDDDFVIDAEVIGVERLDRKPLNYTYAQNQAAAERQSSDGFFSNSQRTPGAARSFTDATANTASQFMAASYVRTPGSPNTKYGSSSLSPFNSQQVASREIGSRLAFAA